MMYWKETPLEESFLSENHMPVSDKYFKNQDGSPATRNVFDYIRDHLGYRLENNRTPGSRKRNLTGPLPDQQRFFHLIQ